MAAALPAIKFAAPFIASGIGSLLGKKKNKSVAQNFTPNPAYTQPLAQFGGSLLPQAQAGFQKAFDYYGGVLQNPEQATASDAASIARQTQQLTDRAARTAPRGGASAATIAAAPQQQMAAGLGNRLAAQANAAQSIGTLAGNAGQLGAGAFGTLLGNENQARQTGVYGGYLDLARTQADRGYYGQLGGSIFDILRGVIPGLKKGGGLEGPTGMGLPPGIPGSDLSGEASFIDPRIYGGKRNPDVMY